MLDHPILFSTEMVRAILEGRKTQTRRIIKESYNGCWTNGGPHPCPNDPAVMYPGEVIQSPIEGEPDIVIEGNRVHAHFFCSTMDKTAYCRYGKPGDWLWVRETWVSGYDYTDCGVGCEYGCHCPKYLYKASCEGTDEIRWKPSIHMPKNAARIWLQVEEIKAEALQNITEEDAKAEGIDEKDVHRCGGFGYYESGGDIQECRCLTFEHPPLIEGYKHLWMAINGEDSWKENPWVWAVKFKVLSTTGRPSINVEVLAS